MKIINLTPHAVTIYRDGQPVRTIEPSGTVARVTSISEHIGEVDGIPVYQHGFGAVENMPEPVSDTIYLVSMVVGQALAGSGRTDIYGPDTSPAGAVRDAEGRIIGTRGLVAYR